MINQADADAMGDSTASSESAAVVTPGLRARAEQDRRMRADPPMETLRLEEASRLLHELRVHQIELELQNEDLRSAQLALERSHARYFELYDLAPVGYLTLSDAGLIEEANLAAASLLGLPRQALVRQPLSRFIRREDLDIYYRINRELTSTGEDQRCELRLSSPSDPETWILMDTCLAAERAGEQPQRRCVLVDITDRKRNERALRDATIRLRLVTDIAGLTCWEWDPQSDRLAAPSADPRASASTADVKPLKLAEWAERLHPEDRSRILAAIRGFAANPGDANEIEYRIRETDSGYRWLATRLVAIRDSADVVDRLLLMHQDITRRKASEEEAILLAQHDPLTGLLSRSLLEQLAAHALAGARRSGHYAAVLFFDLDRFKDINDLHGHAVGDAVLQEVASRLRGCFRAEDLVSRLGGDEFVVVLAHIRASADAARAAEKAIAVLTLPYTIEGHVIQCLASLGISLFPQDGATLGQLIRAADLAMYQAKTLGIGQYRFATGALDH
jgi:diguanylate cyclase (GGDEF)-like protein/PAS domain S-box-containing protein